jgi:hypothetical protein
MRQVPEEVPLSEFMTQPSEGVTRSRCQIRCDAPDCALGHTKAASGNHCRPAVYLPSIQPQKDTGGLATL